MSLHTCLHTHLGMSMRVSVDMHVRAHVSRRVTVHACLPALPPSSSPPDRHRRGHPRMPAGNVGGYGAMLGDDGRAACLRLRRSEAKRNELVRSPARTRCLAATCAGEADRHGPILGTTGRTEPDDREAPCAQHSAAAGAETPPTRTCEFCEQSHGLQRVPALIRGQKMRMNMPAWPRGGAGGI